MYSALDLAKYIVDYCYKKYKPVSNLKLQKMLYFIWVDYYKDKRVKLFNEKFYAWQFGPVVMEAYNEFCSYGGMNICRNYEIETSRNCNENIDKYIDNYIDTSARELVERSHREGGAWDRVYKKGLGLKSEIPVEIIVSLEVDS